MNQIKKIFFATIIAATLFLATRHTIFHYRSSLYDKTITRIAQKHKVSPAIIKAIIRQESKFQPNIRGGAGEYGLMQIMPEVAQEWARDLEKDSFKSYETLLDPYMNIEIGTWYFAKKRRRWKTHKDIDAIALACYNAGTQRAIDLKWIPKNKQEEILNRVSFPSTRKYISNIIEYRNDYKKNPFW